MENLPIQSSVKHYSELSLDEFHDMIALRMAVFVVEQNCPYQDLDGLDRDAFHVLIKFQDELIATARILKAGVVYPEIAIGRVASSPQHRDKKLGHLLMTNAMSNIFDMFGSVPIKLSAQSHLTNYYAKHGFSSTGKTYLEDGIPHTEMSYKP